MLAITGVAMDLPVRRNLFAPEKTCGDIPMDSAGYCDYFAANRLTP